MRVCVALLAVLACAAGAQAQGRAKLALELAELVAAKIGAQAGSIAKLTTRIETLAARHGDEVVSAALRKGGPGAMELVEQAGANAGQALRAVAAHGVQAEVRILARPAAFQQLLRYGDDAGLALVKHPGVAEPLIEKGGANAVKALAGLEAQAGRRLAILSENEMSKHGSEMFAVAAKHGPERVTEFLWKHRKELAVGTAAAAFVANPEPFLDGTSKLVTATGDAVVKPVAQEVVKPVVQEAVGVVHTVLWALLVGGVVAGLAAVYLAVKHPAVLKTAGRLAVAGVRMSRRPGPPGG